MFHNPTQPALASRICAAMDVTEGDEEQAHLIVASSGLRSSPSLNSASRRSALASLPS
jgi:hypothetical protein